MKCCECGCDIDMSVLYSKHKELFDKINEGLYFPTDLEESIYLEKLCSYCFIKLST